MIAGPRAFTAFLLSCVATFLALDICSAQPAPAVTLADAKPGPAIYLFYSSALRRPVLLANARQSGRLETWALEGRRWTRIAGDGPSARDLAAAAYDSRRDRLVLHGGIDVKSGQRLSDTWEWDGKQWRQVAEGQSLGNRDHHSMAYDEARGKIVLFGGAKSESGLETDTWEWDGDAWMRFDVPGPAGRAHFPMVYDRVLKKVILFGGIIASGKKLSDTWAWDGKSWEKLSDEGPTPRYQHRMAYNSDAGVAVLFGGLASNQPPGALADTWIWDGKRWTEHKVGGPAKRNAHVMAYDASRKRVILFGGGLYEGRTGTSYDDIWEWDGAKWLNVTNAASGSIHK